MEEEFRPAFREAVLAYALASALIWLLVSIVVFLLPVPGFVVNPVDELAGTFAAMFFILRVGSVLNLHAEERYYVGEGVLRIRHSLASTTAITILLENVTRVRVDVPFFMRPFHVGTVWVYTCDSRARPLFNLKDPLAVAEKIRPKYHWEGVFRPTVG